MQPIFLASGSFLKKFIMDASRLPYESIAADIDESIFDHLPVDERVVALAKTKCDVVAKRHPDAIVIAADTLTANTAGEVFSKQTHAQDPFKGALALSGKTIWSVTGCAFYSPNHRAEQLTKSRIDYQAFSESNLQRLTAGDNSSIRSGALGLFHDAPGFTLVQHLEGSYTGAFGLPMEFIYEQLEKISYFQSTN
jgi:septum formation protein